MTRTTPRTINRRELRLIYAALSTAVEWEKELIAAHTTHWSGRKGSREKIVPKEFRPIVNRLKRRIAAYRKLSAKVSEQINAKGNGK